MGPLRVNRCGVHACFCEALCAHAPTGSSVPSTYLHFFNTCIPCYVQLEVQLALPFPFVTSLARTHLGNVWPTCSCWARRLQACDSMLASGRHGLERPQTLDSAARSRQQRGVPHRSRVRSGDVAQCVRTCCCTFSPCRTASAAHPTTRSCRCVQVTPDTLCASSSGRPAVWTTASATGHLTGVRRAQAVASPAGVASSPSPSPRPAPSSEIDYFLNDSRPVILFDGVCNM